MGQEEKLDSYYSDYFEVKSQLDYLEQLYKYEGLTKKEIQELEYLREQERGIFNEIYRIKTDLLLNDEDGRKVVDSEIKTELTSIKRQNLKFLEYIKYFNPVEEIYNQRTKNDREKLVYKNINQVDRKDKDKVKNITGKTIAKIEMCACRVVMATDDTMNKRKIIESIRCNNRFCPYCSKNKSIIDAIALQTVYSYIKEQSYKFIFLTLTVPNIPGEELKEQNKKLYKASDLMFKYKRIKKIVKGYTTKLEVTYNKEMDTYHPHLHIIITVNKSYFTESQLYISHQEWLELWKKATGDYSITQVDVRRPKNKNEKYKINSEIMELTKYIAKDSDYLYSEEVFRHFYNGLKGARLYRHGGVNKEAINRFKKGELNDYITEEQVEYVYKFIYHWNFEDNSYTRNDEDIQKLTVVEKVAILNARKKNIVNEFNETEKE